MLHNIQACSFNLAGIGKSSKYYIFCVGVCSLSYPACIASNVLSSCLAPLYNIYFFPNHLINGTVFGKKKIIERKMSVLIFSIQPMSEAFLIL